MLSQLIGRPRARAQVAQWLAQDPVDGPDTLARLQRLRSHGELAFDELVDAADKATQHERDRIAAALSSLYSEALAPAYLRELGKPRVQIALTIARALAGHRLPDPDALLAFLEQPGSVKAALYTVLAGQVQGLSFSALLRTAGRLSGTDRSTLFELLRQRVERDDAPELLARLQARDADYRLGVVRLLGRIPSPAILQALSRSLSDVDGRVRRAALEALAREPATIDPQLLCRCLGDPQLEVQARAIELLSASPQPGIPGLLAPLLGHESSHVRRAAVEVLSQVATADNIRALLDSVRDKDWWVRSRSADVLGRIGGPRVVQAALALLRDDDAFIRRTAVEIIHAAGGSGSYDALATALNDDDWWVRERAIDGLAASGDPRAARLLREWLLRETAEQTRVVLIGALARMKRPEVIADLAELLPAGSRNVRRAVLHALAWLREVDHEHQAVAAAARLAADPDEEIRALASQVMESPVAAAALPPPPWQVEPPQPQPQPQPMEIALEGQVIEERYRVLRQLGRGAFGTVLLVTDLVVKESLALKFLHPHLAGDEEVTRRFVRELRLARRITHPGVIRIHDLVTLNAAPAIAMEYFPSRPLTALLRAGLLELANARSIALQLAEALAAAHAVGVIHRDLKPANVLVNDAGLVKVADFGIAAAISEEATRLTKAGVVVGTPRYMSPEQIQGQPLDARSDIHSLGTLMYELLTGRTPIAAGNHLSIMFQHLQGVKEPPSIHRAAIPARLDQLVMSCLAVRPEQRPASMDEIAAALGAMGTL